MEGKGRIRNVNVTNGVVGFGQLSDGGNLRVRNTHMCFLDGGGKEGRRRENEITRVRGRGEAYRRQSSDGEKLRR